MAIDPLRHVSVFSPAAFGARRVDVIGAGALGGAVVLELAKLGVQNIHVWDDDAVADHNLANQVYGPADVGSSKVDALASVVHDQTGTVLTPHAQRVTKDTRIEGEVVFLMVDSMAGRKEIAEGALFHNSATQCVVEARMGAEHGLIQTWNPSRPAQNRHWQETLYDDSETEESVCGSTVTVGATAKIIAGMAVWQMIRWVKAPDDLQNQITLSLNPFLIEARTFKAV